MVHSVLDLGPIGGNDTGAARDIDQIIENIVNGSSQVALAAQHISQIVIQQSEAYFAAKTLDANTQYSVSNSNAGPAAWQEHIWDYLGRSSMVIPTDHPGQACLVSLLVELQKLPKETVQAYTSDDEIYSMELWTLTKANRYSHLQQDLWQLAYLNFQTELKTSAEARKNFVNYSAFLARLLAAGVVDTTRIFEFTTRDFRTKDPTRRTLHLEEYEARVATSAQWVFQAGSAMFEMCEKKAVAEPGGFWWTRTTWESMKKNFGSVAVSSKFAQDTQETAAKAAARMDAIEKEGVVSNVVESLEFHVQMGSEEEEDA